MQGQRHIVVLYVGFIVLWGLSVDHPDAPLRDYGFLKWFSAWATCLLVATTVAKNARGRLNIYGLSLPVCILMAWVVLSAVRNGSTPGVTLVWLVFHLKYVFFLLYLNNLSLRVETVAVLLRATVILGSLLVVEGYIRTALDLYDHPDQLSSFLGPHGTVNVGFVCCIAIIYLTACALVKRKWSCLLLGFALVSIAVPGEIKALTISGPLMAAVVYFAHARGMSLRIPLAKWTFGCAVVGVVFWGLALLYLRFRNPETSVVMLTLIDNFQTWLREGGSLHEAQLNRLSTVAEVVVQLREDPTSFWLGRGPGATFGSARQFVIEHHSWNQIGKMLADIGVMGTALYVWMLTKLSIPGWRMLKRLGSYEDKHRILILTFAGVSVYYVVVAPMYDQVWRYDAVGFVFFALISGLYRLRMEAQASSLAQFSFEEHEVPLCPSLPRDAGRWELQSGRF